MLVGRPRNESYMTMLIYYSRCPCRFIEICKTRMLRGLIKKRLVKSSSFHKTCVLRCTIFHALRCKNRLKDDENIVLSIKPSWISHDIRLYFFFRERSRTYKVFELKKVFVNRNVILYEYNYN